MKKIISIALILLLLAGMMPTGAFAVTAHASAKWQQTAKLYGIKGSGTERAPYRISEGRQLDVFLSRISDEDFRDVYFELTGDVETSSFAKGKSFAGHFNGNGHSINVVFAADNGGRFESLFPTVAKDGVIKNLTVTGDVDTSATLPPCYFAPVCKINDGLILNCVNDCDVKANVSSFGGICLTNNGKIANCVNKGALDNSRGAFGICAENYGTVANCVNYGEISKKGGICGKNEGTVENCYFTNAPDNGIGAKLTEEQITAESGSSALIYLLNSYKLEGDMLREKLPWTTDDNGYPQLDFSKTKLTGSILSHGYPEIVFVVGGLAVGLIAAMLIFRRKKVAASSTSADDEE